MNHKLALLLCLCPTVLFAQPREVMDISANGWNITLDKDAPFENDELFLPPVNVNELPVNIPSGGWKLLDKPDVTGIHLPATVEEYLWGWNGETFGVTGDYVGVSWFETEVDVPASWQGRRVVLDFEGVRFRAEVFVNYKLAGYDLVNSTPFGCDVSGYLNYGGRNVISVRITDPNGNFNWKDSEIYTWGEYNTNPSHGFGGINGKVSLTATSRTYVSDIFVKNTPTPTKVDVAVSTFSPSAIQGQTLTISIRDRKDGSELYRKSSTVSVPAGDGEFNYSISCPKAKLWSVEAPNLYDITVSLGDDSDSRRMGFRWFEVRDVKGERQFYLNGRRIVLRTSISWSFWPDNGLLPSDELARRQVESAKALGLNMLNFHRMIGQPDVIKYADELGLLIWEEPGGNQYPAGRFNDDNMQSRFYFAYRNEKLARMIKRDRSFPSLIIYNLHNERGAVPQDEDYREMAMAHSIDPTRILLYNSSNGQNPEYEPYPRTKTHYRPYDDTVYDQGWWDVHHAGGPGSYHDALYVSKDEFHRNSTDKSEIVYWGEEGAIGTPPRLQLIRDEILASGKKHTWEAQDYLDWYDAYNRFLDERGFRKAFPTVDALTTAMGNVAYYYQGRIIENIRISDTVDGYAINGWESMKLENHSGVVDNYRHPKGDVSLISRYNQPLVLSVKLNRKVLPVGGTTTGDVFIINEKNLKGSYQLEVCLRDQEGKEYGKYVRNVKVSGGAVYGECLADGMDFRITEPGYSRVEARLLKNGREVLIGSDDIFAVRVDASGISSNASIADTGGVIDGYLRKMGIELKPYTGGTPEGDYLLVGDFEPIQFGSGKSDILNWVYKGHNLVIVDRPERWAEFLADKEVLDYRGSKIMGTTWYGGNFFNREHPVFEGLPQNCAFNWEYQCFSSYNRRRIGLRCGNGEVLAASVADHKKEVYTVLGLIRAGRGQIIFTTLDIPACIKDMPAFSSPDTSDNVDGMFESMNDFNLSGDNAANVVGQQLLLNMLKLSSRQPDDN